MTPIRREPGWRKAAATPTGQWRIEADDEWLAAHSSTNFARLRRRFGLAARAAGAVSSAELGPFGGAPRNPRLKLGGKWYSFIRYVDAHIAYTTIRVELERCPRCGSQLQEAHHVLCIPAQGVPVRVGAVRMCRRCHSDAWLFVSRMPAATRARDLGRRAVL